MIDSEVVNALLDGQNPIKVWREHRGVSQSDLESAAGISVPYLSQLETEKRKGSLRVLTAIANALNVPLETLVPKEL